MRAITTATDNSHNVWVYFTMLPRYNDILRQISRKFWIILKLFNTQIPTLEGIYFCIKLYISLVCRI
jgi:hypothetical protein